MVVENLYRNAAAEPSVVFNFSEVMMRMLHDIYEKKFNPRTEIDREMFEEVWAEFNRAVMNGYGEPTHTDAGFDFYQALRRSNAVFSAFKVHRMQNDMAAQLLDADGKLKPFEKWREDVAAIADHQVGSWLRTEYDTAIKRAHLAADWQQFEAEADLFPNLEWLPSTSAEPRLEHMAFYGLILPIHHPFWREYFPGNVWGCKCGIQSTDAPRTPEDQIPVTLPGSGAVPGLDANPAHTGEIFSRTHPYYTEAYKGAKKAVEVLLDEIFPDYADVKVVPQHTADYTARVKEIRQLAKPLREEPLTNPGFDRQIEITMRGIKEYLNQPHVHYAHKNELLLNIPEVMRHAKYMGAVPNFKDVPGLKQSHIFEIRILGDKSWIVVRETTDGQILFHSISDSSRVLEGVKK